MLSLQKPNRYHFKPLLGHYIDVVWCLMFSLVFVVTWRWWYFHVLSNEFSEYIYVHTDLRLIGFNLSRFFFQLKCDALASESVTSNKKRKTCTDPAECEENMCSVSTPDNISTVTTDTTQVDEMELCAPSTSGETLCTPVTDLASNSSAPDGTCTTASLSTPSATPLTSRQASVASSQSCKGCTHAVKYQSLQKANKRLKAQVKELKKTITELRSVSTLCIFI